MNQQLDYLSWLAFDPVIRKLSEIDRCRLGILCAMEATGKQLPATDGEIAAWLGCTESEWVGTKQRLVKGGAISDQELLRVTVTRNITRNNSEEVSRAKYMREYRLRRKEKIHKRNNEIVTRNITRNNRNNSTGSDAEAGPQAPASIRSKEEYIYISSPPSGEEKKESDTIRQPFSSAPTRIPDHLDIDP